MIRKVLRGAVLTVLTAAAILLAMKFAPESERDVARAECRDAMTSTCLLDLGVAEALGSREVPAYLREVSELAAMGRIEDAAAIELRIQGARSKTPEAALAMTDRAMASHRLAAAIRRGASLEEAIEATPQTDGGTLWIAALDLIGRHPYGLVLEDPAEPDAATQAIVAEMAEAVAGMAAGEAEGARQTHLVHAAELRAELGQREDALRYLSQMPRTGHGLPLSERLVRLIGPKAALAFYPPSEAQHGGTLRTAAAVARDPSEAEVYVEEAFALAADATPWPDYSDMERTVKVAAKAGLPEQALMLGRRMEELAASGKRLFPAFGHICAARALLAAGANEAEVRGSITHALAEFPSDEGQVVGFGLVGGVMQWGRSGLGAEARHDVAHLLARLGETAGPIGLMEGIGQPDYSWLVVLTPEVSVASYGPLLEAARGAMRQDDFDYVQALLAANIYRFGGSEEHRAWALATAQEILGRERVTGPRAVTVYDLLVEIGFRAGDRGIERRALERLGEAALASGSAADLLRAGIEWHAFDQRRAR